MQLAVACCRWCFAGDNRTEVDTLGHQVTSERLLSVARRHRIVGLVWQALPLSALTEQARRNAEQGLTAAGASRQLLAAFERTGIPLLFLKGLTTGQLAWNNPFLKTSWDLDVLVLPENVARAASILAELGYQRVLPVASGSIERWHRRHKESVWRNPDGLHLELHTRLVDQPQLLPTLDARAARQDVTILPNLALPTLAEDELFAYLCVHGASSAWFRLKWIADLAALIHTCSAERLEQLFERSRQLGAGRAPRQALLLIVALFGPLPSSALQAELEADTTARLLARAALDELLHEREPTQRPLGTAMIHATQLLLLPGARYSAAEALRQIASLMGR